MPNKQIRWFPAAILIVICASCGINDKDLLVAANAYWSERSKRTYKLLAEPSKEQWARSDFLRTPLATEQLEKVMVVGEKTEGSRKYANVSRVYLDRERDCRSRYTGTWIQENGRWRNLVFPETQDKASSQFKSGDYTGALETTEEWLKLDPFSISALKMYIFAQDRSGSQLTRTSRSSSDILRSMIAINPEDSTALFTAASYSEALGVARGFFNKIPIDDCDRDGAAFNILNKITSPGERIRFLDQVDSDSPSLHMQRVKALNDADRGREAIAFLKEKGEMIATHLQDKKDPGWSANWASAMGVVAVQNGDDAEARRWLELAASQDPQNAGLARLDRRLNDPCCNALAARLGKPRVVGRPYRGSYAYSILENLSPVNWTQYRVRAEAFSPEGFPIDEDTVYGNLPLRPSQQRELEFIFFKASRRQIAEVKVELTSISAEGLDRADPSFWVRMVPSADAAPSAER